MIPTILSKLLPLAADPFPPTHKAGSEFEGFFIRLQSHSGRSSSSSCHPTSTSGKAGKDRSKDGKRRPSAKDSPSRIPRLARDPVSAGVRRRRRERSFSTSSSSSSSSHEDPPSPTPDSRRLSSNKVVSPTSKGIKGNSPRTKNSISMLTDIDPVFASPESLLPSTSAPSFAANPFGTGTKAKRTNDSPTRLPTSPPGDLILVICELQSAPIDQRICIYLRWILHDEEPHLYQSLHFQSGEGEKGKERQSTNAKGKQKDQGKSFELIHYIPSWHLKVGQKAGKDAIQPFRINLPSQSTFDNSGEMGFLQVLPDGKLVVDITLPNRGGGTRVKLRSTKHCPWHPHTSTSHAMGSRGPEGWIQHLGLVLPLHWYVHSSSAPALFSIQHTPSSNTTRNEKEGGGELQNAVAAGLGLIHIEKNWGQAFPSGWMWAHGSTPLPNPSFSPNPGRSGQTQARISLAGGKILGLTAFLVGIHIKQEKQEWDWNFKPPFAFGPQYSFPSSVRQGEKARLHFGPGLKMTRNFTSKTFTLDVWTFTRWASIQIQGDEDSFATQIPGPCKNGWTPGYCHHSYRCKAEVVLYERSIASLVSMPVKAIVNPLKTLRGVKEFWRKEGGDGQGQGQGQWEGLGWEKVVEVELGDRVALEFGGDFAN